MTAHSSFRGAPMTWLLSFISCPVRVFAFVPIKCWVGPWGALLGPVDTFCIICEVSVVVPAMVMSSDGIIRSLRSYPATSLLESTLERC